MPGPEKKLANASRLASWYALAHLCRLVCNDKDFRLEQAAMRERFGWVYGHSERILSEWHNVVHKVRGPTGAGELNEHISKVARRYKFDRIPGGEHLMFLMLVFGKPPGLLDDHPPIVWKLEIQIRPDESLVDALGETTIDLERLGQQWTQPGSDVLSEYALTGLRQKVDWFFAVKVKGITVIKLAMEDGPSESTISRGMREVGLLLDIPGQRGRPRK